MVRREREKTTVEDVKQIFRVFDKVLLKVGVNWHFAAILFGPLIQFSWAIASIFVDMQYDFFLLLNYMHIYWESVTRFIVLVFFPSVASSDPIRGTYIFHDLLLG